MRFHPLSLHLISSSQKLLILCSVLRIQRRIFGHQRYCLLQSLCLPLASVALGGQKNTHLAYLQSMQVAYQFLLSWSSQGFNLLHVKAELSRLIKNRLVVFPFCFSNHILYFIFYCLKVVVTGFISVSPPLFWVCSFHSYIV